MVALNLLLLLTTNPVVNLLTTSFKKPKQSTYSIIVSLDSSTVIIGALI